MNEQQQEMKGKISKEQQKFLSIIMTEPDQVFDTLSYLDIIKPLVWKELVRNGGKLGIKPIAKRYGISEKTVRTLIKQVEENKTGVKKTHFRKQKRASKND
jgi:hypothetical protein